METIKILAVSLLLSGCVSGDCVSNCYLLKTRNHDLEHKCNMDPYRPDCPTGL